MRTCDHIFFLDKGRLVDEGDFDALRERSPLFRLMVEGLVREDAKDEPDTERKQPDGGHSMENQTRDDGW